MSFPVVPQKALSLLLLLTAVLGACACERKSSAESRQLTFAAYSVPREAFGGAILPAYKEKHRQETGKSLEIAESYMASGAQSRAIVAGFNADIAVLSLEPDIQRLVDANLVPANWKKSSGGIVSRSVVVLAVRKGNPKNIQGWSDIVRDDLEVLTANPKTSGGAMWNILAAVGAVERDHVKGFAASREGAEEFLSRMLARVRIMDRSGRESMMTFERGVGDVIITYENEVLTAKKQGKLYDYIVPESTILIENPVAVVEANAKKHQLQEEADRLVKYLFEEPAQLTLAKEGFRPVHEAAEKSTKNDFAALKDSFSIDDLGGWIAVQRDIFSPDGLFERSLSASRIQK